MILNQSILDSRPCLHNYSLKVRSFPERIILLELTAVHLGKRRHVPPPIFVLNDHHLTSETQGMLVDLHRHFDTAAEPVSRLLSEKMAQLRDAMVTHEEETLNIFQQEQAVDIAELKRLLEDVNSQVIRLEGTVNESLCKADHFDGSHAHSRTSSQDTVKAAA
jgi:hypothetical protein